MLRMHEITFPGFEFQKCSGRICPQTPLGIHAWYVGHMAIPTNVLSRRKFSSKNAPPHGKILKKGPDKISNKVVYVYCVSKVDGQTNTVPPPPPPQTKLGPYAPCTSMHTSYIDTV